MENKQEKMEFTVAQKRAISVEKPVNRIVIAMAGSGKTTVLTEYYFALVNAGLKPSEIVAVTFTDKAARSMRTKLIRKFVKVKSGDIVRELYAAPISTIHSFCANIVREYALVSGLDPDFKVLDEIQSPILIEECLRVVMSRWREEHLDDYEKLLGGLSWGRDPYEKFKDFYGDFRSRGLNITDLKPGPPVDSIFRQYKSLAIDALEDFIRMLSDKDRSSGLTDTEARKKQAAHDFGRVLANLDMSDCSPEKAVEIRDFSGGKQLGGIFANILKESGKELIKAIRDFANVILYVSGGEIRRIFLELANDFENEYKQAKDLENLLDFDDLQDQMYKLLRENPAIAHRLKERIKALLIDEFQDTNLMQMSLVELLKPDNRLFMVGDPRQSIYGFRHSEVGIMLGEMEKYQGGAGEVIPLDSNFRSRGGILDVVSSLFEEYPIDDDYSDEKFGRIIPGRDFANKGEKNPVEIIVAMEDTVDDARKLERVAIAGRLADLLKNRMMVEERDGTPRPLKPSDIAILFRAHKNILDYARALEDAGIPHHIVSGGGFHHQREVMDLVNYLELMEDPYDPLALSEVIRASFAGISAYGLFRIITGLTAEKQDGDFKIREQFWLNESIDPGDNDLHNWKDFKRIFENLLDKCMAAGPAQRLRAIIDETHFRGSQARGRGGHRRLGNIGKLLDFAEEWERNFPGDNHGFIERMKELRFREAREPESPVSSGEESVSLMTIHASKGLEFPVVVLADSATRDRSGSDDILLTPDNHVLIRERTRSTVEARDLRDFFVERERDRRNQRDERESLRVLYVALTRAMEKLIISFSIDKSPQGRFFKFFDKPLSMDRIRKEAPTSVSVDSRDIPVLYAGKIPETRYEKGETRRPDLDIEQTVERIKQGTPVISRLETVYPVTAYTAWIHCPRRMSLRYLAGLGGLEGRLKPLMESLFNDESVEDEETVAVKAGRDEFPVMERGTIIHKLLSERISKGDGFSWDSFLKSLTDIEHPIEKNNIEPAMDFFLDSQTGRSIISSDVRKLEEPLVFKIPDCPSLFRAVPDAAWMVDGKWRVVDFKSGKPHSGDDPAGLSYAEQVRMYARGVESVYGGEVDKASILYVDAGMETEVGIDDDAMKQSLDRILRFIKSIDDENYPPSPNDDCKYCIYKEGCPAF